MKRIRQWIAAASFAFIAGGGLVTTVPTTASAACGQFLTFPTWYEGVIDCAGKQTVTDPQKVTLTIIGNVVEIILQLVGYVSFFFIIYGGFLYMVATGDPSKLAGAKTTILNAVIGLIVAIFAVAAVNFVSGAF